jgi:RsiW-degrading membrane proteinase PrsW (M82 family)
MEKSNIQRSSIIGLWAAGLGMLIGVSGIVAVLAQIDGATISALTPMVRGLIVLGLSVVPAVLWLAVIVVQDRNAPEPRTLVIGLFVLGAVLMGGAVRPLESMVQLSPWADAGPSSLLLGGLIRGIIIAALTYAAVRCTVLPTATFDQPIDGLVYGVAVTMGMATADGMSYLFGRDIRLLGSAMSVITVDVLVYIAIGAVVGHVLGMIKPGRAAGWVGVIAVLGGGGVWAVNDVLDQLISQSPVTRTVWASMVPAALVLVAVLALVTVLIRRGMTIAASQSDVLLPVGRADWYVAAVLGTALLAGGALRLQGLDATRSVVHGPLTVVVPKGLLPVVPGMAFPAQSNGGVLYAIGERPSAGSATADVAREQNSLMENCYVYPAVPGEAWSVLESVCLPSGSGASATHEYLLVLTSAGTTYTVSVSGAEQHAERVAVAWSDMVRRLTQPRK